jgi:cytochrome c oxidase assembly factor CtaG
VAVLRPPTTNVAPVPSKDAWRAAALGGAVLCAAVAFIPPIWDAASRYEFVETVQFAIFAFALPALLVVGGGPWRLWGAQEGRLWRRLEQLESGRQRHPDFWRAGVFAVLDVTLIVLWRIPPWMDALARDRWLVAPEALSLVAAGLGLWLELVACPPLTPRLAKPWGAALAAACMWTTWIMAYVVGFAHVPWYRAFPHAHSLLGVAMDQEVATAVVWLAAAFVFVPVVFVVVIGWLASEGDLDAELRSVVRAARRTGRA